MTLDTPTGEPRDNFPKPGDHRCLCGWVGTGHGSDALDAAESLLAETRAELDALQEIVDAVRGQQEIQFDKAREYEEMLGELRETREALAFARDALSRWPHQPDGSRSWTEAETNASAALAACERLSAPSPDPTEEE